MKSLAYTHLCPLANAAPVCVPFIPPDPFFIWPPDPPIPFPAGTVKPLGKSCPRPPTPDMSFPSFWVWIPDMTDSPFTTGSTCTPITPYNAGAAENHSIRSAQWRNSHLFTYLSHQTVSYQRCSPWPSTAGYVCTCRKEDFKSCPCFSMRIDSQDEARLKPSQIKVSMRA